MGQPSKTSSCHYDMTGRSRSPHHITNLPMLGIFLLALHRHCYRGQMKDMIKIKAFVSIKLWVNCANLILVKDRPTGHGLQG